MKLNSTLTLVAASTLLLLSGCDTITSTDLNNTDTTLSSDKTTSATDLPIATPTLSGAITNQEATDLIYMREEEKLARDVYRTLYNTWAQQVFAEITLSEQQHTDSMQEFLFAYGVSDPVVDDTTGVFTDPKLAQLYRDLIAQGTVSEVDAIKVGIAIEEIDMVDLQLALNNTSKTDIQGLYENLLTGSRNHLRAFVNNLQAVGEVYTATYITQAEADTIINSPMETGNTTTITGTSATGGNGNGNGGAGNGGGNGNGNGGQMNGSGTGADGTASIDTTVSLTQTEIDLLVYMREEEKLARDVYLNLYDTWGISVFNNISDSESGHTQTMQQFITAYGLTDPVVDDTRGVFSDPHLAQLYSDLISQGMASEEAAIRVGIAIEEIDMIDLQQAIDATINSPELQNAYNSLMEGSKNHLRAFVNQLTQMGLEYQAQYISQAEADAILNYTL